MFLVVLGNFRMDYREDGGAEKALEVGQGEFVIVPRGTEHRPVADREVQVLLFEPAGTLNTGNVGGARTVEKLQRI
jgi:mannose-6-phosphate isomerase-like protein (cupin superfamily)